MYQYNQQTIVYALSNGMNRVQEALSRKPFLMHELGRINFTRHVESLEFRV